MSLSLKAVDHLFSRLMLTYGRQFMLAFDGLDMAAVKSLWAHELGWFHDHLDAVAWALEHLPDRPPNVLEFRSLCRKAPIADVPRLPEPKADPERIRRELAKLEPFRQAAPTSLYDHKAWAKVILADHEAGVNRRPVAVLFAKQALGVRT